MESLNLTEFMTLQNDFMWKTLDLVKLNINASIETQFTQSHAEYRNKWED